MKAIVTLNQDNRFVLRMEKAYWLLVEDPTQQQTQAIKAAIQEINEGEA